MQTLGGAAAAHSQLFHRTKPDPVVEVHQSAFHLAMEMLFPGHKKLLSEFHPLREQPTNPPVFACESTDAALVDVKLQGNFSLSCGLTIVVLLG